MVPRLLASVMLLAGLVPTPEAPGRALQVGDALPAVEAESLVGRQVVLPQAIQGRAAVLVFSFSQKAGKPAVAWGEALQERFGNRTDVEIWRVLVLEDVPPLLRGFVTGSIKRSIPQSMHIRSLKLYRDAVAWKQRLGMQSVENPCVVLLDAAGKVRWLKSGPADGALLAGLQDRVDDLRAPLDGSR